MDACAERGLTRKLEAGLVRESRTWVEGALEPQVGAIVSLPRPLARRWISDPDALHGAIIELGESPELSKMTADVIARLDTMTRAEAGTVLDSILDLAVLLLKRKQPVVAEKFSPNSALALVQQARSFIKKTCSPAI